MVKRSSFSIGKPICQCTILSSFSYYTSLFFFWVHYMGLHMHQANTNNWQLWVHYFSSKALKTICFWTLYICEKNRYLSWMGVAFYISNFFKGKMLFTFIVLIGTRWSFLKLYLEDRKNEEFPWLEFQDHCRRSLEEWETRVG